MGNSALRYGLQEQGDAAARSELTDPRSTLSLVNVVRAALAARAQGPLVVPGASGKQQRCVCLCALFLFDDDRYHLCHTFVRIGMPAVQAILERFIDMRVKKYDCKPRTHHTRCSSCLVPRAWSFIHLIAVCMLSAVLTDLQGISIPALQPGNSRPAAVAIRSASTRTTPTVCASRSSSS